MTEQGLILEEGVEAQWKLFPKQWEGMQACAPGPKNLVLFSGPRYAAKTVCALHALVQHAWNTDRANLAVISLTQSVGIDSGVWTDLIETVLPDWIAGRGPYGNLGMKWIKPPYIQNVTKKPACEISNRFGNRSKFQLDSLKNEEEVEGRYKGKRYSSIFLNEFSKFKKRKTFDTLKQCLRMMHLKAEEHLFLADTNPDLELGAQSPWYHLWYEFRNMSEAELAEAFPHVNAASLIPLRDSLRLIEFTIDDNLSLSAEKKDALLADFSHDLDLQAAYYYGKWTTASADAIFAKVFRESVHVIGEMDTPGNPDPETLVPQPDCVELCTGWDLGSTNSAVAFIEKVEPSQDAGLESTGFKQLDEVLKIGDALLGDVVEQVLEKMDFWERIIGKPVMWKHYSDRNVFAVADLDGRTYLNQKVFELSDSRIPLIGAYDAQRGASVERRIDFFRRLLFEGRYVVSRTRCPGTINALKSLRRGKGHMIGISKGSPHKHPFDATTYAICSEAYMEMMSTVFSMATKKMRSDGGTVVQMSL